MHCPLVMNYGRDSLSRTGLQNL